MRIHTYSCSRIVSIVDAEKNKTIANDGCDDEILIRLDELYVHFIRICFGYK